MIDDMAVYIANLGKYNEGYLVGAWFTFPIDEEDVKEKIGLNEQYEEYAIHDTDNFPIAIGEYVSIEELNEMYEMIEELPDYIVECLDEFISHYGTLEDQRQALLLLTAYFSFKGQSETWLSFPFRNLRKELKELEKD